MSAKKSRKKQILVPVAELEPTGMWYIRLRLKNSEGKTESFPIREKTEAKAIARAMAIKSGLQAEALEARRKAPTKTLREIVDEYVEYKTRTVEPSTLRGYDSAARNRFKAYMDFPIDKIDFEEMVFEELEELAPKTVKNGWMLVCPALERAGITPPKIDIKLNQSERPWLMPDDIKKFVVAIRGRSSEIGALLALHGLRASEICALTWDDVNLETGAIRIAKARTPDRNNKLVLKDRTKTPRSTRTVMIVIPRLLELLNEVENKEGFILTVTTNWLYKQINAACESCGLPEVGIHGLRHTFASLCYFLRVPEMEVCTRGGWKSPDFVHRVYTHLSEMQLLTADRTLYDWYASENAK